MQKRTVVVLAVAFAGTASAAGWRDLRVDGSSDEAFAQSMTEFKDALSSKREYVFGEALKDIWNQGAKAADAEQREYTAGELYRQLDGLRYEEIVNYTDPTGETARTRYQIVRSLEHISRSDTTAAMPARPSKAPQFQEAWTNGRPRGWTDLYGVPSQR